MVIMHCDDLGLSQPTQDIARQDETLLAGIAVVMIPMAWDDVEMENTRPNLFSLSVATSRTIHTPQDGEPPERHSK